MLMKITSDYFQRRKAHLKLTFKDLDTTRNKARRVRSWYLQEQYNSLKKYQDDAAQKLRGRSYQESILVRELSERKARRRLCDQYGICESESSTPSLSCTQSQGLTDLTDDDSYRSMYGSHAELYRTLDSNSAYEDTSVDDSKLEYDENDFPDLQQQTNELKASGDESVTSVVENINNYCEHEEAMSEDLNSKFNKTLKNIEAIERCTISSDKLIDCESKLSQLSDTLIDELQDPEPLKNAYSKQNYAISLWTRLVSFAYQVMQLNRGNCYHDYSTQILTAVLACDVLRRTFTNLCNILQPYVCPVKLTSDAEGTDTKYTSYEAIIKQSKIYKCRKKIKLPRFPRLSKHQVHSNSKHIRNRTYYDSAYIPRHCTRKRCSHLSEINAFHRRKYLHHGYNSAYPSQYARDSHVLYHSEPKAKSKIICTQRRNPMIKVIEFIDSKYFNDYYCRLH